eukprot:c20437_g1_i1 orf=355-1791(+)
MGGEVGDIWRELRATFKSGCTRPLSWRLGQVEAVSKLLREREEEINNALLQDLGKPRFETYCTEIALVANSCKVSKDNLKRWISPQKVSLPLPALPGSSAILAEPLGVVLIFSAWNFPLLLALDPLVGALAAGNTAVLKPSEIAPATSSLLAKLIPIYLDTSAVRVVEGSISESTALLEQKWDKIFFTGSTQVGRIIMTAAAKYLTPVTLELGGKCPVIMDHTTDLEVAARRIVSGKWGINFGQACLSPDYILAEEKIIQKLTNVMKKTLKEFYGEDPIKSHDLSRIVSRRHFSRLKRFLEDPRTSTAVLHGGECDEGKLFIQPTILLDPPLDTAVMTEEIFGPILPIITIKTIDDAIDFVNARPKPLCLYLFTNEEAIKEKVVLQTSSGALVINDCVLQFGLHMIPFGGVGESGMGKYHGKCSFDTFSHMKPVVYRMFWGDVLIRYPPYTQLKESILKATVCFDYLRIILVFLGLKK